MQTSETLERMCSWLRHVEEVAEASPDGEGDYVVRTDGDLQDLLGASAFYWGASRRPETAKSWKGPGVYRIRVDMPEVPRDESGAATVDWREVEPKVRFTVLFVKSLEDRELDEAEAACEALDDDFPF